MTVRLYFNRHGSLPWSVDSGPGTEELQFESVDFTGSGSAVCIPQIGDPREVPCAWVEFLFAELRVKDSHAIIVSGSARVSCRD